MEFKDFAQNEASALLERLTVAAQAATQKVREDYETQLTGVREQADALRQQLEKETARAEAVEADLDTVIDAHKTVDVERLQAQAALDVEGKARAAAEEELRRVRELLETSRVEIVQLEEVLESEMAQKAVLESDLTTARASIDALRAGQQAHEGAMRQLESKLVQVQAAEASLRKQSGDSNSLLQTLTSAADSATKRIREEADEEIQAMREALDAARREAAAAANKGKPDDGKTLHDHGAMLTASVRALERLGAASTVADLLGALVTQLSLEFPRVALFRVKGNHLEGERGSGLDSSNDITKLVIPISMDSVITRAANLGTIEDLASTEPCASNSPLGGSPASAIALPVRFQGDTLAVVYADSETAWGEAHTAFATLLLRHTDVLLTRLTQELKTLKELRAYAEMLVQEAEQMFLADLEAKRPEKDRVRRLQETIECGRHLFAQRASLEGPLAGGLLDEQIETAIRAKPVTPFGKDLTTAVRGTESKRNAS